jgi:hypothetical protein
MQHRILKDGEDYSFSQYFQMPFDTEDILQDLDCSYRYHGLQTPISKSAPELAHLQKLLERNRQIYTLDSETDRREALIAPILQEVCLYTQHKLRAEYPVFVSDILKGVFDYYLQDRSGAGLLVIEAKQFDLRRGFTQLAVELIALDQWTRSQAPVLYGVVTTGDRWKFGSFDRAARVVTQSTLEYTVKDLAELTDVVRILIGILEES